MNKVLFVTLAASVVLVSACANTGGLKESASVPVKLVTDSAEIKGYEGPRIMNQDDVIMNTRNCIDSGMRARVVYMPQRYPSGTVDVPVAVNCYPSWNMK